MLFHLSLKCYDTGTLLGNSVMPPLFMLFLCSNLVAVRFCFHYQPSDQLKRQSFCISQVDGW